MNRATLSRVARPLVATAGLVVVASTPFSTLAQRNGLDADLRRATQSFDRIPASSDSTGTVGEVDRLAAQAATAYRARRYADAVAAFDRAAGAAFRADAKGRAFELALAAAELQRTRGRWRDASQRFAHAALSAVRDPRAPRAHHAACVAWQRSLDAGSHVPGDSDSDSLNGDTTTEAATSEAAVAWDRYDELLAQHAATWPNSQHAAWADWERVELLARRGRWQALLERLRLPSVPTDRASRARELTVDAHRALLVEGATPERLDAARADLQPLILGTPPRWPESWSPLARYAAWVLGRSQLARPAGGAGYARQLLRNALKGQPAPAPPWRLRALSVLIVASLAESDREAAAGWIARAYAGTPQERAELLATTAGRVGAASVSDHSAEADRLRMTLAILAGEDSDDDTGDDIDGGIDGGAADKALTRQADALRAVGRDAAALERYAEAAASRPDDRSAQEAYARALGRSEDAADRERAIAKWREVESRTVSGTPAWFAARRERLVLLAKTGRRDEARKLLALTRLLGQPRGEDAAALDAIEASLNE